MHYGSWNNKSSAFLCSLGDGTLKAFRLAWRGDCVMSTVVDKTFVVLPPKYTWLTSWRWWDTIPCGPSDGNWSWRVFERVSAEVRHLHTCLLSVCENMLSTVHANAVIGLGTNEMWSLLSNSIEVKSNRLALSYQLSMWTVYLDLYLTVKARHVGKNTSCTRQAAAAGAEG